MCRIHGEVKPDDDWLTLQELRARSLLALGRPSDSLKIAEVIAREVRDSPVGWTLLAEAREALVAVPKPWPRVAAMEAAAAPESPALRESHGLVWRLPTAPITAPPVVQGSNLLVGCRDGRLLTIDTRALRVVKVEQAPVDIEALSIADRRLIRRGADLRDVAVGSLNLPPGDLRPHDPLVSREEPSGLPQAWYNSLMVMGLLSSSAAAGRGACAEAEFACLTTAGHRTTAPRARDRVVANCAGRDRAVRVWDWRRLSARSGPRAGRTDHRRRSGSWAIEHGLSRRRRRELAAGAVGPDDAMRLQLWSRNATKLLLEVAVRPGGDLYREPFRLRRLGDGTF